MSPVDLAYCINIGRQRTLNNRANNVKEQKQNMKKSSEDVSIQGVIGEFFMLNLFGQEKSSLDDTTPNNRTNDRGDIIFNGLKIDVKCAEGPKDHNYPLKVRYQNKKFPSDIYLLCTMKRLDKLININLNPIQNSNQTQSNNITFNPNERIELVYHGCVSGKKVFQPTNQGRFDNDYYVQQHNLEEFDDVLNFFQIIRPKSPRS